MKKILLILAGTLVFATLSFSQTTILDFETAATSAGLQHFGGNLEGAVTMPIDNPNATGVNTSSTVIELKKASDAPVWGGAFTEPNPGTSVDLTIASKVCVDVHLDHIGNVALKLEDSPTGQPWILSMPNTVANDWERLCYDVSLASIEAPVDPADGHVYNRVVLFLDFGVAGNGTEGVAYIDNIAVETLTSTNNLNTVDNLFKMQPTLVSDNALITFQSNSNSEQRELYIVSTLGEVLVQQNIDGNTPSFDVPVERLSTGVYFAQMRQGNDVQVVKFIVQ